MTILKFQPRSIPARGGWREAEIRSLSEACAALIARGQAAAHETGTTDAGDPQFYLLDAQPDRNCLFCVSRIGSFYVLQNDEGRILLESRTLDTITEYMRKAALRLKPSVAGCILCAWIGTREAFAEKFEPLLIEPAEMWSHFGGPVAALV
ncbi:MAG: hypothetical protein AB7K04_14560 [Pseudorhodoplanes sp.]